jgi:colanic acid/amylovoran biosynthesis protein
MMSDFGMGDFCVAELSEQSLLDALAQLLHEKDALAAVVAERAATLKQRNQKMWQRLAQVI